MHVCINIAKIFVYNRPYAPVTSWIEIDTHAGKQCSFMDSQDCINISPDRSRDWGSSIIPDLDKISSAEFVCRGMRKRSNKRERDLGALPSHLYHVL